MKTCFHQLTLLYSTTVFLLHCFCSLIFFIELTASLYYLLIFICDFLYFDCNISSMKGQMFTCSIVRCVPAPRHTPGLSWCSVADRMSLNRWVVSCYIKLYFLQQKLCLLILSLLLSTPFSVFLPSLSHSLCFWIKYIFTFPAVSLW